MDSEIIQVLDDKQNENKIISCVEKSYSQYHNTVVNLGKITIINVDFTEIDILNSIKKLQKCDGFSKTKILQINIPSIDKTYRKKICKKFVNLLSKFKNIESLQLTISSWVNVTRIINKIKCSKLHLNFKVTYGCVFSELIKTLKFNKNILCFSIKVYDEHYKITSDNYNNCWNYLAFPVQQKLLPLNSYVDGNIIKNILIENERMRYNKYKKNIETMLLCLRRLATTDQSLLCLGVIKTLTKYNHFHLHRSFLV